MRKIAIFIICFNFLFAYVYNIKKGWNLIGIHSDIDIKKLGKEYKIIWSYKDGKWLAFSPDNDMLKLIKNKYEEIKELNSTQAVWIYSDKNYILNFSFLEHKYIKFEKNWQLISLPKEGNISSNLFNNQNINFVWKYDNSWYGYSPNEYYQNIIKQKYNLLDNIKDYEGFWINAKNKGNIYIGKNYSVYFYYTQNGRIYPLQYQKVKDNNNNLLGYTNVNGRILINSPKTLMLNDNFDYLPIAISNNVFNYVSFVSKKDENKTKLYSDVFDIGNYRFGGTLVYVEAKIPPKVFLSLNENYGFIVKKFTSNEDITISIIPKIDENSSILGSMEIKLEDSLGNEISQDNAGFSGEFQIYMKSKKIDDDVIVMQKKGDKLDYISDTYYLNGKYYSKKNITSLGEFLFVKTPRLYTHKLYFTNVNKVIVIDSNFNSYVINKYGEFKSINSEESISIFADDFKSLNITVKNDINITLQPKKYYTHCINIKNLLTNKVLKKYHLNGIYGNEIVNLNTDNSGKACFVSENNLSNIIIDDVNYTINKDLVNYLSKYIKISANAVSYSNLNDNNFTYFVYNTTAGAYMYNIDTNKSFKLENYIFNSINENIIADIADNIYQINNNKIEKSNFSKDDFFDDIGNFVFAPVKSNEYLFFPTTNAKIILTNLDGNTAGVSPIYLKTYDDNKTNNLIHLYDINDSYVYGVVNEGLVYLINKDTQNAELIMQTDKLNSYNVSFDNNCLYIATDKIYKIDGKNINVYMNIKANKISKKDKYFIIDNYVYINGSFAYSFKGNLIKIFKLNNNLMIVTENAIYKNNEKILTFNEKIVNCDLKNGYFLIEFDNGKNLIFK